MGGDKKGQGPTDRGKPGDKKCLHVEALGGPLKLPDDTNVHDTKLLAPTLAATVIKRLGHRKVIPHQCMDKGYDNPTGREACEAEGYIAHIHRRGVKKLDSIGEKTHPARRLTIWSTSH